MSVGTKVASVVMLGVLVYAFWPALQTIHFGSQTTNEAIR